MIFSCIYPSPVLQPYVRDYLIAHFLFDEGKPIPPKPYAPKPEQGLTFFVRGRATMISPLNEAKVAPQVSIFGQQTGRCNIHLTPEFLMFRVHFRPGVLFRLFGVPLVAFSGDYFDAERLLDRRVWDVQEQLASADTYPKMVEVVEKFLLRLVKQAQGEVHPLDQVAACLTASPTRFSLDWLASQACLSPRQFNRKFTERMGVGPKLYSRLVRFFNASRFKNANPEIDWLTVAVQFGYTDYQHLAKDFRQFTAAAPNLWIQEEEASPEHLLRLARK